MEWIADVAVGAWLRARLDDTHDTMHTVVPRALSYQLRPLVADP